MPLREKLTRRTRKVGLSLSSDTLAELAAYFDLLRRWNQKVSLTSLPVDEFGDEAIDRLLVEPLLAVKYLPHPGASVMDIGSGGGSPAIPMKIAAPGIALRMVESKTRKAAFLREVVRQLDLSEAVVETARFEELLVRPELHEAADALTMRAVRAERKTLLGLQTFLRPGGSVLLFRTGPANEDTRLVVPPLSYRSSEMLIPSLGSRLAIFDKEE